MKMHVHVLMLLVFLRFVSCVCICTKWPHILLSGSGVRLGHVHVQCVCLYMNMYMNNQVYRALLRKNEKGKKEKERKLQQPQRLRKI